MKDCQLFYQLLQRRKLLAVIHLSMFNRDVLFLAKSAEVAGDLNSILIQWEIYSGVAFPLRSHKRQQDF